jgi:hypothetical protein
VPLKHLAYPTTEVHPASRMSNQDLEILGASYSFSTNRLQDSEMPDATTIWAIIMIRMSLLALQQVGVQSHFLDLKRKPRHGEASTVPHLVQ